MTTKIIKKCPKCEGNLFEKENWIWQNQKVLKLRCTKCKYVWQEASRDLNDY